MKSLAHGDPNLKYEIKVDKYTMSNENEEESIQEL